MWPFVVGVSRRALLEAVADHYGEGATEDQILRSDLYLDKIFEGGLSAAVDTTTLVEAFRAVTGCPLFFSIEEDEGSRVLVSEPATYAGVLRYLLAKLQVGSVRAQKLWLDASDRFVHRVIESRTRSDWGSDMAEVPAAAFALLVALYSGTRGLQLGNGFPPELLSGTSGAIDRQLDMLWRDDQWLQDTARLYREFSAPTTLSFEGGPEWESAPIERRVIRPD